MVRVRVAAADHDMDGARRAAGQRLDDLRVVDLTAVELVDSIEVAPIASG